jgi:hypothetical protein
VALTGSTDFTLLFDGRMREIRRINVPWLGWIERCFFLCPFSCHLVPLELLK